MGALYLARDPAIDRLLAIKVLRRGFDSPDLRERFSREARAAGRLRHPNIVTIFDVGEDRGDPFIAMEFLAGETLSELLRHRARLSLARRVRLIEELCDGLSYAHRAGIVHRDIKPANLMVDSEGILKILDFGIVRVDESAVTQAGVMVGTVNYMSPEQVVGGPVDHRSDIFAVGLVAYELLTARQAFPGTLKDGLLNRILNVAIEPLPQVAPTLDAEIVSIVERALKADPVDRYQDLARMRNDLLRVRLRLEAAEDRAVEELAADSGETVIATDPVPTPASGTPARSSPVIEAAERALSAGDYGAALTLAGRTAAAAPHDPAVSSLMARAEAGLLARGRSMDRTQPEGEPAGSRDERPHGPRERRTLLLVAGTILLGLAGLAASLTIWRGRVPGPASDPPAATAGPPPAPASGPDAPVSLALPADPPAEAPAATASGAPPRQSGASPQPPRPADTPSRPPRGEQGGSPAGRPESAAAAGTPAPRLLRVGADVGPPRRIFYTQPVYPASATGSGLEGTVRIDLIIGRDGRVADAEVTGSLAPDLDQAALAAARKWEFQPVTVKGQPVAVVYPVSVEFVLPETTPTRPARQTAAAKSPPPAASEATRPTPAPSGPPPASKEPAPVRDGEAEVGAIREAIRLYERAWESRDPEAVARRHALSPAQLAEVRATLAQAREYQMQIEIRDVQIGSGGRVAKAACSITRTFRPHRGNPHRATVSSVMSLEKRGDAWIITDLGS